MKQKPYRKQRGATMWVHLHTTNGGHQHPHMFGRAKHAKPNRYDRTSMSTQFVMHTRPQPLVCICLFLSEPATPATKPPAAKRRKRAAQPAPDVSPAVENSLADDFAAMDLGMDDLPSPDVKFDAESEKSEVVATAKRPAAAVRKRPSAVTFKAASKAVAKATQKTKEAASSSEKPKSRQVPADKRVVSAVTGLGCAKCRFAPRGCKACLNRLMQKRSSGSADAAAAASSSSGNKKPAAAASSSSGKKKGAAAK